MAHVLGLGVGGVVSASLLRRGRRRGRVAARVLIRGLVPRPHLVGVRRVRRKPGILVGRAGLPSAVVAAGGQAVEVVLHAAGVAGRRGRHADRRGARGVRRGGPRARVGRRRSRVRHLLRRGRCRGRVAALVLVGRLVPRHHLVGVRGVRRKPGVLVGRAGLPTAVVAAGGQAVEEVLHPAGVAGRGGRHADRRGARGVRRGGPCARVGRRWTRVRRHHHKVIWGRVFALDGTCRILTDHAHTIIRTSRRGCPTIRIHYIRTTYIMDDVIP